MAYKLHRETPKSTTNGSPGVPINHHDQLLTLLPINSQRSTINASSNQPSSINYQRLSAQPPTTNHQRFFRSTPNDQPPTLLPINHQHFFRPTTKAQQSTLLPAFQSTIIDQLPTAPYGTCMLAKISSTNLSGV